MTNIVSGLAAASIGGLVAGYVNGRVDKNKSNLTAEKGALYFGFAGGTLGALSPLAEKNKNNISRRELPRLIKSGAARGGSSAALVGAVLFGSYGLGEKLGIEHAVDSDRTIEALKGRKKAIDPSEFQQNNMFGSRER